MENTKISKCESRILSSHSSALLLLALLFSWEVGKRYEIVSLDLSAQQQLTGGLPETKHSQHLLLLSAETLYCPLDSVSCELCLATFGESIYSIDNQNRQNKCMLHPGGMGEDVGITLVTMKRRSVEVRDGVDSVLTIDR